MIEANQLKSHIIEAIQKCADEGLLDLIYKLLVAES